MPGVMFLEALGGLGLFILGMRTMSEGLQRLAGERLRRSLEKLAGNRFTAAFLGGCLSSLLQSGGAASIVIIGFVNAGLLSLYQALGMLIGTGLGTTFVVQIIAFRISFIAAPGIFAGAIMKFFSKKRKWEHLGEVILGVSLLFFGLQMMEANFSPLKESAMFAVYQSYFPSWHLFSVILGAALTFFVQSGSAATGIIIALAGGGLVPIEPAVAMVLGEILGTIFLAAIGTVKGTLAAKRTVLIYFIMAVFLLSFVLLLFPLFLKLVLFFTPNHTSLASVSDGAAFPASVLTTKKAISRFLANAHTIFSLIGVVIFLPLVGFFARNASKILPSREGGIEMEPRLTFIDFRIANTPVIAFSQARSEVRRMAELSKSMFCDVVRLFDGYDSRKASVARQKENVLDSLQKDISGFLVDLAPRPLTPEVSVGLPVMLQTVNGLESIGDHAETVLDCLRRKKEGNVYFSDAAMDEIRVMASRVTEMFDLVLQVFDDPFSMTIESAASLQATIKDVRTELRIKHVSRLSRGACTVIAGLLYIDIISSFDRIGELCLEIIKEQMGET
jgi:phosphate:Na+ symporter